MKLGTKSVLFGVHAFWYHQATVALAWRKFYGHWPDLAGWIAIAFHDLGYWGCSDIDGPEGRLHPGRSAKLAATFFYFAPGHIWPRGQWLILGHSKHYARLWGMPLSDLYVPDKVSVLFDPCWFYLLRGLASGEIWEFVQRGPIQFHGRTIRHAWRWLNWYRDKVRSEFFPNPNETQD